MAASRFPGKPMAKILGVPMIGHIVRRSAFAKRSYLTYVATCDQEIHDYVLGIGGRSVMTKSTHERATERAAEALLKVEAATGEHMDTVLMVQGDEPMVDPQMIDQMAAGLEEDTSAQVLNLMVEIKSDDEFEDANAVKVVLAPDGHALYFSREPIPSRRKGYKGPRYKQLGMIGFRRDYLLRYIDLPPTPLEVAESVDMMRVLEHGDKVRMQLTEARCLAVDAPHDVPAVEAAMNKDVWLSQYAKELQI